MKPSRISKLLQLGAVVPALMHAQSLLACSVCYGRTDSPLGKALNWGILSLLLVLVAVLAGVAFFFVHVGRRSAAARHAATVESSNPPN